MHFVYLFHLAYVLDIYFIESTPGRDEGDEGNVGDEGDEGGSPG